MNIIRKGQIRCLPKAMLLDRNVSLSGYSALPLKEKLAAALSVPFNQIAFGLRHNLRSPISALSFPQKAVSQQAVGSPIAVRRPHVVCVVP
jgi:hypothetical protein